MSPQALRAHPPTPWLDELRRHLRRAAAGLDLVLPPDEEERLLAYFALLHRLGAVRNLTALHRPADLADRHWADAVLFLRALPQVEPPGPLLVDVGSGAGLPGLPLLLRRPWLRGVLVERSRTKSAFLRLALGATGLRRRCTVLARDALALDWHRLAAGAPRGLWIVSRAALNQSWLEALAERLVDLPVALTISQGSDAAPPTPAGDETLRLGPLGLFSSFSASLPLGGGGRRLFTFASSPWNALYP